MDFFSLSIPIVIPLGIAFIAAAVADRWVFGPLRRAAVERDYRVQFTLADVLCLFVAAQLALGTLHWETRDEGGQNLTVVFLFILLLVVFGWWQFVRMLSRAGVRVVWQRCVFMLVALPVTVLGSYAVAFAPFAVVDLFMNKPSVLRDACILLAAIVLPGVIYRLGRFTRAIVASAAKK
jgi:hypothetical protein